ncbi:MAG: pilus assembly protein [Bdellovibrionales bacterium]|nr:pilus assembly protein [Bdellovibrionales bacterium]
MKLRKNESGQATIEFALTLILLLVFVFFYVQLGLVMAFANYVQYATFMSSRALVSSAATDQEQNEAATRVLGSMVKKGAFDTGSDRWPSIAKGVEGDAVVGATIGSGPLFAPKNKDQSWQEGVRYTFRSRLFLLPFGDVPGAIKLTSESWLGREPTKSQCETFMSGVGGIIDNGC